MAIPTLSKGRILIVLLALAVPVLVFVVHDKASEDCVRVDQALRHWVAVLPDIHRALAGHAETGTLASDTAAAAEGVREEAESIADSAPKATVTSLADTLDLVSQGNPKSPPNGFPDKTFMSGFNDMTSISHDLKVACPDIGD
jgi:protein-disulfide isomerase